MFTTLEQFRSIMRHHGITVVALPSEKFQRSGCRRTSSFTETHHDMRSSEFYLSHVVTVKDLYHEFGHLVHWVMVGSPRHSDNFAMSTNWTGSLEVSTRYEQKVRDWVRETAGPIRESVWGNRSETVQVDVFELAACAVEAACLVEHVGVHAASRRLRDDGYTGQQDGRITAEMTRIGQELIRSYGSKQ